MDPLLVESYAISRIRVFSAISGAASSKNLQILRKTINNAVRVIYNLRKFDHVSSFCDRVPWGNVDKLSKDSFTSVVSKVLQGRSSAYLESLIETSSHNLTRRHLYLNDRSNTNAGQRKFRHRAAIFLNQLSVGCRMYCLNVICAL